MLFLGYMTSTVDKFGRNYQWKSLFCLVVEILWCCVLSPHPQFSLGLLQVATGSSSLRLSCWWLDGGLQHPLPPLLSSASPPHSLSLPLSWQQLLCSFPSSAFLGAFLFILHTPPFEPPSTLISIPWPLPATAWTDWGEKPRKPCCVSWHWSSLSYP